MGTLYLVPTPIGNREDITWRAVRVLGSVSLIAAEDTRTTGRLLAHYEITTPQTSYHEHNKIGKLASLLQALAQGDVALVSDAGTPGLSDPGYELVQAALENGFPVVPLPGATAVIPALVASGLPTDRFAYLGFLPRKAGARQALLESVAGWPVTLVFFEAPHRLIESLGDLEAVLGDRPAAVARELSKLYEEIWRGPLSGATAHFTAHEPRGEITLVVGGALPAERWTEEQVRAALADRLAEGDSRSAAARAIARDSGWSKRDIYGLDG